MKQLIFVIALCLIYAGSIVVKNQSYESKKGREVPTLFKYWSENGTPVETTQATKRDLVNYVIVTGASEGGNLVKAFVAPDFARQIKNGARTLVIQGKERVPGVVTYMTKEASLLSGLHELHVRFGDHQFKKESVRFGVQTGLIKDAIVVKREAISTRGGVAHTFVIRDEVVVKQEVKIVGSNGFFYAIGEGLNDNDSVVLSDKRYLKDNQKVLVVDGGVK